MKRVSSLALVAGLSAIGASAQTYDLTYNAGDGEVTMTIYGNIINYVLESSDDIFTDDAALAPSTLTPFVSFFYLSGNPVAPNGTVSATPKFIGESNQSYNGPQSGEFSLGLILPSGLTQQQFIDAADLKATYVTGLGNAQTPFNLVYYPSAVNDLVYNTFTGSLTIRNNTESLASYSLESGNNAFISGNFLPALNGSNSASSQLLTETNNASPGTAATYNLGNVLPLGLTELELESVVDLSGTYNSTQGASSSNFNLVFEGPADAINDLVYSAQYGTLTIQNNTGAIATYTLSSDANAFLSGNHTPILGGSSSVTSSTITESNANALATGSSLSLGNLLPARLLEADFLTAMDSINPDGNTYKSLLGEASTPFNLVYEPYVGTPGFWVGNSPNGGPYVYNDPMNWDDGQVPAQDQALSFLDGTAVNKVVTWDWSEGSTVSGDLNIYDGFFEFSGSNGVGFHTVNGDFNGFGRFTLTDGLKLLINGDMHIQFYHSLSGDNRIEGGSKVTANNVFITSEDDEHALVVTGVDSRLQAVQGTHFGSGSYTADTYLIFEDQSAGNYLGDLTVYTNSKEARVLGLHVLAGSTVASRDITTVNQAEGYIAHFYETWSLLIDGTGSRLTMQRSSVLDIDDTAVILSDSGHFQTGVTSTFGEYTGVAVSTNGHLEARGALTVNGSMSVSSQGRVTAEGNTTIGASGEVAIGAGGELEVGGVLVVNGLLRLGDQGTLSVTGVNAGPTNSRMDVFGELALMGGVSDADIQGSLNFKPLSTLSVALNSGALSPVQVSPAPLSPGIAIGPGVGLDVSVATPYAQFRPTTGQEFVLLETSGSQSGTFASVTTAAEDGILWLVQYNTIPGGGNRVIAKAFFVFQPGDADTDGDVDDADLGGIFASYTGPGYDGGDRSWSNGDHDNDGDVDDSDLASGFANYTGPLTPAVPEPNTLALLGMAGMALASRRR